MNPYTYRKYNIVLISSQYTTYIGFVFISYVIVVYKSSIVFISYVIVVYKSSIVFISYVIVVYKSVCPHVQH